jgi:hypothetical protein
MIDSQSEQAGQRRHRQLAGTCPPLSPSLASAAETIFQPTTLIIQALHPLPAGEGMGEGESPGLISCAYSWKEGRGGSPLAASLNHQPVSGRMADGAAIASHQASINTNQAESREINPSREKKLSRPNSQKPSNYLANSQKTPQKNCKFRAKKRPFLQPKPIPANTRA